MPKVIRRSSRLVRSLRALSDSPKLSAKMRLRACEDLMLIDPSINDSELRLRLQMHNRTQLTPLALGVESSLGAEGGAGQREASKDLEALALKLGDRNDPRNEDADLETLLQCAPAGGDSKAVDGRA